MSKPGRNDPCPCGSGKKYKLCCLRNAPVAAAKPVVSVVSIIQEAINSHQAGRLADAAANYRQAIGLLSHKQDMAIAHNSLGVVLNQLGKTEEAETSFRKAISLKPDLPEVHGNLGNLLRMQGRLDEAKACFRTVISLDPNLVDAHFSLAAICTEQGRTVEATPHLEKVIAFRSGDAEVQNLLGNAYCEEGRFDLAAEAYQKAISLMPDFSIAYSNLATVFWKQGNFVKAMNQAQRAVSLDPKNGIAHNCLGLVLMTLGKLEEACSAFRNALSQRPDLYEAHNNLAAVLQNLGLRPEAISHYQQALALKPDHAIAYSGQLHTLNFMESFPTLEIVALAREWEKTCVSAEIQKSAVCRRFSRISVNTRRLKIGYVSADFRQHAVAYFIEPVLANHDKKRFEVCCYYNHHHADAITERLGRISEHWVNCYGMPDASLAERIYADGIDILVDLAGHTEGNRLLTFAARPAPVQITYLGYPGTTGLTTMDYRLTDARADPPGSEHFYTERLLRMPDSLWCYRPSDEMPLVNALPAQSNGYITFGSLNNSNKIDSACIRIWSRLLLTVRDSRLLIVTVPEGARRHELIQQFGRHGVDSTRLEFFGKLDTNRFLRIFHRVDVALDPINVNGATTTCESLWMGVPTLSLSGNRFLSRAGLSILSAAGAKEFSVANEEDFLEVAKKLTGNLSRLSELRARLRDKVSKSPLTDAERFTRHLEEHYYAVWNRWTAK